MISLYCLISFYHCCWWIKMIIIPRMYGYRRRRLRLRCSGLVPVPEHTPGATILKWSSLYIQMIYARAEADGVGCTAVVLLAAAGDAGAVAAVTQFTSHVNCTISYALCRVDVYLYIKFHTRIHIHNPQFYVDIHGYIFIRRCLSCTHMYLLNIYKAQWDSTSIKS